MIVSSSASRCAIAATAALCAASHAQSLLVQPPLPQPGGAQPNASAMLAPYSMFAILPPEPKEFRKHDLITIIIDESSTSQSTQTLETEKETERQATLGAIIDPIELLNLRLRTGASNDTTLIDADAESEFTGEGEYERRNRMSARVTARIIDVKPNGTLVLEARKRIANDKETTLLVVAGYCRSEDITTANTILSSQIADLTVIQQNAGDLKDAAEKGFFTRAMDFVFDF